MGTYRDWTRREVVRTLSITGGGMLLGGCGATDRSTSVAAALETTSIRLILDPEFTVLCYAPQYLADTFLEEEGFTDIQYVPKIDGSEAQALVQGHADMSAALAVDWVMPISQGIPVMMLGGLHPGCVEIFANDEVTTIRELKGRRIGVSGLQSPERYLLASIVAHIGLDPAADIEWVFAHPLEWGPMLAAGQVDAIAAFPPMNQALHEAGIGHVILDTTTDDPWQHYFCCMISARREYVTEHPVATKAALRAILRANSLCNEQPEVAAQRLVDKGVVPDRATALHAITHIPYNRWHDYDPVDSVRFYSLRLREAGLITQTPEEILRQGTDWRFFNELRTELA
jgi:NitT/TauT family transport system substrate-binding protein